MQINTLLIFGIYNESYITVWSFIRSHTSGPYIDLRLKNMKLYNVVQGTRFGNPNLERNLPSHQSWKWKKESANFFLRAWVC